MSFWSEWTNDAILWILVYASSRNNTSFLEEFLKKCFHKIIFSFLFTIESQKSHHCLCSSPIGPNNWIRLNPFQAEVFQNYSLQHKLSRQDLFSPHKVCCSSSGVQTPEWLTSLCHHPSPTETKHTMTLYRC